MRWSSVIGGVVAGVSVAAWGLVRTQPEGDMRRLNEIAGRISRTVESALRPGDGEPTNYAAASLALRDLREEYERDATARAIFGQIAGAALATTSDYDGAIEVFEGVNPGRALAPVPEGLRTRPAAEAIAEMARDRRIVMLNEAHHVGMHRSFARRLLRPLREAGFTHLAVEGLANSSRTLEGRDRPFVNEILTIGYPTQAAGYYTADPMFGELLREAIELGFVLVPYEAQPRVPTGPAHEQVNARDAEQAANILRVLEDGQARVLVYCGYAHLSESPQSFGDAEVRWLGARLREATGLDPLTIHQTSYYDRGGFNTAAYEAAIAAYSPGDAVVLMDDEAGEGVAWSEQPTVWDVSVLHPTIGRHLGRPGWMMLAGDVAPVEIPDAWIAGERSFVQAFRAGEDPAVAVPADQAWAERGGETALVLRAGEYVVRTWDADAEFVEQREISVRLR